MRQRCLTPLSRFRSGLEFYCLQKQTAYFCKLFLTFSETSIQPEVHIGVRKTI